METKKLSIEKMQEISGGDPNDYCSILSYWLFIDASGFQGNINDVRGLFDEHCH